jgi:hypothetical protein
MFLQKDPSTPNASLVSGCKRFVLGTALLRNLGPVSECANYLIKTVDPKMHSKMVELREKMIRESAHVQAICAVNPSLHTTLGIIVNRISGRHKDSNDAQDVWAVMFVLGNFTGGEAVFSMPDGQEVTTRFKSGDAILLKARNVFHEIKVWEGDLRVTLVYYSNKAVWTEYNTSR